MTAIATASDCLRVVVSLLTADSNSRIVPGTSTYDRMHSKREVHSEVHSEVRTSASRA